MTQPSPNWQQAMQQGSSGMTMQAKAPVNLEREEWRDIAGYEDIYQVSNLGRVKSLARMVKAKKTKNRGDSFRTAKERILSNHADPKGYVKVKISKNVSTFTAKLHRLVAVAFLENPLGLRDVNHIDGIKANNRVENLEWCTHSYNILHAFATGLKRAAPLRGEKSRFAKLTTDQVLKIRALYAAGGITQDQLAFQFGVTQTAIGCIVRRKVWTHLEAA